MGDMFSQEISAEVQASRREPLGFVRKVKRIANEGPFIAVVCERDIRLQDLIVWHGLRRGPGCIPCPSNGIVSGGERLNHYGG